MRVHQTIAHRGPVIESMIQVAGAPLLFAVERDECGVENGNRIFYSRPFPLAALVFRDAGLKTSLVTIRSCIAYILIAIGLGKEQSEADAACHFCGCLIESFRSGNCRAEVSHVFKWRIGILRIRG